MNDIVVETRYGKVRGFTDGTVCQWRGIPFAKPPVGSLRLKPPEPPEPWTGVRDATEFGPASVQPEDQVIARMIGRAALPESEDCLYLNVWSPAADGKRRPVMVWIHGGAYVTGAGSVAWYDGTSFAREGDVVLVTVNYRLGALGFLHLVELFGPEFNGSGNLGILDQIAALRWVHENIEAFGGDPDRVTIFGESAGAGSVGTLLAASSARGLFRQAIMQSGSGALGVNRPDQATATARRILAALGVQPGDAQALLAVPAKHFVEAAAALGPGLHFGPVVDGTVVPEHPLRALEAGAARDIPILTGVTQDEYNLFALSDPAWFTEGEAALRERVRTVAGPVPDSVIDFYLTHKPGAAPYEKLLSLVTYRMFVHSMLVTVDKQVKQGAPVWVYRFDWKSPALDGRLGACHAQEIPFVFNNLQQPGVDRFTGDSPQRAGIAAQMHQAWIAFAHRADPNHAGIPHWPKYEFERRAVMAFGPETHVEDDPYGVERAVWAAALSAK